MKKVITVLVIVCSTLTLFAQNETKLENSKGTKGFPEPLPEDLWRYRSSTIFTNYKVGIGNTNPSEKLHVTGNALIEGSINCDQIKIGSGTGSIFMPDKTNFVINNNDIAALTLKNSSDNGELHIAAGLQSTYILSKGGYGFGIATEANGSISLNAEGNDTEVSITEGLVEVDGTLKATTIEAQTLIGFNESQWSQENWSKRLYYSEGDVAVGTERLARMNFGKFSIFHESLMESILMDDNGTQHGLVIIGDDPSNVNDQVLAFGADYGAEASYIQSYKLWNTVKKLALNPKGGAVEIGGESTPNSNLHVHGKVWAKEIEVVENVPTADYVFEEDYKLRTLEEVEQFVKTNKHLPDVPSAVEFKENGYKVGDMDNMLLQKVEELTLYIIAQEKRIQKLEEENANLSKYTK